VTCRLPDTVGRLLKVAGTRSAERPPCRPSENRSDQHSSLDQNAKPIAGRTPANPAPGCVV